MSGGFATIGGLVFAMILIVVHGSLRERNPSSRSTEFVNVWENVGKEKALDEVRSFRCCVLFLFDS